MQAACGLVHVNLLKKRFGHRAFDVARGIAGDDVAPFCAVPILYNLRGRV